VNHPGRNYAVHQPTIAKTRSSAEVADQKQGSEGDRAFAASPTSRRSGQLCAGFRRPAATAPRWSCCRAGDAIRGWPCPAARR
jgi:hypothetical protein